MLIKFEVKIELSVIRILSVLLERSEQVLDAVRGECRLAKDTHDFDNWPANLKVMFDDGNVCSDNERPDSMEDHRHGECNKTWWQLRLR